MIAGGLLYVGIAILALLFEGSATGGASLTDPFILIYVLLAALFVVAGVVSLTGKRWALLLGTILTLLFLALTIPFSAGTLANPADPTFWILFSGVALLVLVLFFAIASLANVKAGLGRKRYLGTPNSWGGLLTLAVVGFVVGGVLVGSMTGPLVARILEDVGEPADVVIVQDASLQSTPEAYSPGTLTVSVGATVTWLNGDSTIHTVTSDTGLFDSGNLQPGERFSVTFTEPGTYTYYCIPHPWMTGAIVVE